MLYPFKNLELYLQSIDDKLDTFYHSFSIEPFALRVTNIDRINMQVTMLKDIYVDDEKSEQIFSFSKEVSVIVLNFLTEGFENINKGLDFQQKISKQKILFYLENINIQVSKIFRKDLIEKYPFLYHYKDIADKNILSYINNIQRQAKQNFPRLEVIAEDEESKIKKIEALYTSLINHSLILCNKEDFVNAFTTEENKLGINWIAKSSKNNTTNKPLLVYLFRELANKGHIKSTYLSYENHYLTNIFRNNDGSKFTSQQLSSSKDSMSKRSSPQKELIDEIISKL